MDTSLIHPPFLTPPDVDESFVNDIKEIVIKGGNNIIVKGDPFTRNIFHDFLGRYQDLYIIEIDVYIGKERNDFIEQVVRIIKDYFHEEIFIKEKYESLCNDKVSPTRIDDIFFSIFEELTDRYRIILIFERFDQYALELGNDHYHRLYQLCKKRFSHKVSIILIIENFKSIQPKSHIMNDFVLTFDCDNIPSLSSMPSNKIIYKPLIDKEMDKPKVYISYAWEDESEKIVKGVCNALEVKKINYNVDKKDIQYKGSIREFEESLGKGDFIILIISDKFLKSKDCMYEISMIKQSGNMLSRILPIVLKSAKIYDPNERTDYVIYWEKKINEFKNKLGKVDPTFIVGLQNDLNNYTKYRLILDDILTLFKDMNTLSWSIHEDNNYSDILKIIEGQSINEPILEVYNNNSETKEEMNRIINQKGKNAIYIEKNIGDINIS